jgi:7,8-dihydro-6-hydroxymethylpterin-pyrophosphokinase
MIFVGVNQTKLPLTLVEALQELGDQARYVKIGGNGPNVLDFHIAFYAGQIVEKDLAEIPLLRITNASTTEEKLAAIVERFTNLGHSRPRKVATLKNTINTLFLKKLDDAELTGLVERMREEDLITIDKEKISYKPPISHP